MTLYTVLFKHLSEKDAEESARFFGSKIDPDLALYGDCDGIRKGVGWEKLLGSGVTDHDES